MKIGEIDFEWDEEIGGYCAEDVGIVYFVDPRLPLGVSAEVWANADGETPEAAVHAALDRMADIMRRCGYETVNDRIAQVAFDNKECSACEHGENALTDQPCRDCSNRERWERRTK